MSTLEITASGERIILEMALENACFRQHGCVSVLPLLPIMKSVTGDTITAKKPTKSMNSHQKKTQEHMKGKSPLFIL